MSMYCEGALRAPFLSKFYIVDDLKGDLSIYFNVFTLRKYPCCIELIYSSLIELPQLV